MGYQIESCVSTTLILRGCDQTNINGNLPHTPIYIFIQVMQSWLSRSSLSLLEIHEFNDSFEPGNGVARNRLWWRRVREILTRHGVE